MINPVSRSVLPNSCCLSGRRLSVAVLGALLCFGTGSAWAQTDLRSVTPTHDAQGTAFLIHGNARPAYNVQVLNGGYLVKIDFKDAHFSPSLGTVMGHGVVENVLAENHGHNARLDLLLKSPEPIRVEPVMGGYRLAFVGHTTPPAAPAPMASSGPTTVSTPAVTTGPVAAPAPVTAVGTAINNLHFHRGKQGGGILALSLSGPQPAMNVTREAGHLIVILKHTAVPASYRHLFGVTQFGTPVQSVEVYPLGRNTRLVFTVHGPYTYSAYQLGHQTRIVVRHKTAESVQNPEDSPRLSMDFQDISVRDVLQVIADFTHQNIVVSNNVTGNLTIRLKNEPWKEAFKVILESQGLAVKPIGNILWVAPANQIASQEEATLKTEASERKMEPLETELIQIKYAKAASIAALLKGFDQNSSSGRTGQPMNPYQQQSLASALGLPKSSIIGNSLLGPRGSVAVVTRTNSLLVRDTPQDIENIKKLIAKIDKPVPQVLIKARIVQITTSAAHSLGVNWGGTYTSNGAGGIINLSGTGATGVTETQGGAYPIQGGGSATSGTGFTVPALANLSASDAGTALASATPASLGFALGTATGNRILDLQLQALQVDNRAKIISSPKVLTEDNEKAVISQGQEIPYQQSTSSGATSVSFKKAELSLDVTPHIAPNGKITLKVDAQNNQPDYADALPSGIPITTQEVQSKLLVNNGQTVVIGGIYTDTSTHNQSGVPVLKNIPLLGWLFKSEVHSVAKTELLVFITPEVIGGVSNAAKDDVLSG
ncbi:type IV pilus secretin PilQ [Acidithiobacillus thiooxidans]|nr:type IV pilus secretin PilQ family protein [Acidithiobacillus thiooxidans]